MEDRKTIPNLREALRNICNEWGIATDKISAIVSDGGSNIEGAIKQEFGAKKHVNCVAHLLNGAAQSAIGLCNSKESQSEDDVALDLDVENEEEIDLLQIEEESTQNKKIQSLKSLLMKLKNIVRFFRSSEIATTKLKKLQIKDGKPPNECLKLIQEVRTRWNSCYEMVERFLSLANFVSQVLLELQLEKSSKTKAPNMLSGDELAALKEVQAILKPLWQATMEIISEKIVTVSKTIPLINTLKSKTEKVLARTPIGVNLKSKLLVELKNRFTKTEKNIIFRIGTLLDPRFKKSAFIDPLTYSSTVRSVAKLVQIEINKKLEKKQNDESTSTHSPRPEVTNESDDFWDDFDQDVQINCPPEDLEENTNKYPVELTHFLRKTPLSRRSTPNPLSAWENMKHDFENVYPVAMKYLSIMATSVPCERLFSHAGLIANQLRNRLSAKNLDQLIFLKSVDADVWFN